MNNNVNEVGGFKLRFFFPLAKVLVLILLVGIVYASVFTYYPASITLQPVAPTLLFYAPPYTYSCVGLIRSSRSAITYTDFETYPLSGWVNKGGTNFQLVPGHKGNALKYTDNDGGVGGASQYYYNVDLSSYTSLWIATKVYGSPTTTYKGLSLMNSGLNSLYEISIYQNYVEVRSYLSFGPPGQQGWQPRGSTPINNFNQNYWYTLVVNYAVDNKISFYVWVYDPNGTQVAYLTVSPPAAASFTPAYIGLEVDGATGTFDDFIISTSDPRNVFFGGLQVGDYVEVYDDLGSLTYSFTATSTSYTLNVVRDVVLGRGFDGRIDVYFPSTTQLCLRRYISGSDAFLGGDSYNLIRQSTTVYIDATRTSADITAAISSNSNHRTSFYAVALNALQNYYVMLELDTASSTIHSSLNAEVSIKGATQKVTIVNGVPTNTYTDWVALPSSTTTYVVVENAYTSSGATSTLVFRVVGCVGGPNYVGACVIYPLTVRLNGWVGT